ncbi:putative ABC transport system permease protein [Luteibacter sp. UNC138MFCol5.1]|uniref:ABC transporter permease n=1 Tax=Luteibacter sp. UNC138MFCol5.1 TaxID=1502774 RepID=UPI0008B34404|nr:ABC transporter permease [Luteibacter sp. UNC138MFCol5.1]SEO31263.1 putative ABC transport system permease protein [Luteibacter sp. UNC138MFCol5.1]
MTALPLNAGDIAIATVVVVLDAVLSVILRLQIHRALVIASLRMLAQLVALGFILRMVFALDAAWLTATLVLAMTLAAAREAAARPRQRLRHGHFVVGLTSVAAPAVLTSLFAFACLLPRGAHWSPQFIVPIVGILLGNVLNAVSIGMASALESVAQDAPGIEARLMLGQTYRTSTAALQRRSVYRAMVPLVNQMSAAGIITMPGIMTGQVLAGVDPLQAATYQITLMLLLAGGSGLAAILSVRLALTRLTDERQRLRLDRLGRVKS